MKDNYFKYEYFIIFKNLIKVFSYEDYIIYIYIYTHTHTLLIQLNLLRLCFYGLMNNRKYRTTKRLDCNAISLFVDITKVIVEEDFFVYDNGIFLRFLYLEVEGKCVSIHNLVFHINNVSCPAYLIFHDQKLQSRVWCVNCHLNYARMKIRLTSLSDTFTKMTWKYLKIL